MLGSRKSKWNAEDESDIARKRSRRDSEEPTLPINFEEENKKLAEEFGGTFIKMRRDVSGKPVYFCELCYAEMNAVKSIEAHCGGMKHLKKKDVWERNQKDAAASAEPVPQVKPWMSVDDSMQGGHGDDYGGAPRVGSNSSASSAQRNKPKEGTRPTGKLSGGPTGSLLSKLADCSVKTEDDAELATSVISSLLTCLKDYNTTNGTRQVAELLNDTENKFNNLRALLNNMKNNPGAASIDYSVPPPLKAPPNLSGNNTTGFNNQGYNEGYNQGPGYNQGGNDQKNQGGNNNQGYNMGGNNQSFNQGGNNQGYNQGYNSQCYNEQSYSGYNTNFNDSYNQGYNQGYNTQGDNNQGGVSGAAVAGPGGYNQGPGNNNFNQGYNQGYNSQGYNEGYSTGGYGTGGYSTQDYQSSYSQDEVWKTLAQQESDENAVGKT